jgi:hypothetical protein
MLRTLPRPGIITPQRGIQRPLWPFAVNRDSPQAEGLVGWWPFLPAGGGQAFDLVGGNHGTLNNMNLNSDWVTDPMALSALNFIRANNSYVAVPDADILNPAQFTVSAWISTTQTTDGSLACKAAASGGSGYWLAIGFGLPAVAGLYVGDAVGGFVHGSILINDGLWHSIVGTYDGTTAKIYVDGALDNSGARTGTSGTHTLGFGSAIDGGPGSSYTGLLADIRLYNWALPADLIAAMFDPRTRWDLYYPLRQRVWALPLAAGLKTITLQGSVGTQIALAGSDGTKINLQGSL